MALSRTPLLALSLLGCSPAPAIFLDRGDSATVIVVQLGASGARASAHDLSQGAPVKLELLEDAGSVYALAYDDNLSALRLPAGELHAESPGGRLPPAPRSYRLQTEAGAQAWVEQSELPAELSALTFREGRACSQYQTHQRGLAALPGEYPNLWVAAGPDRVFFATGQRYFEVSREGERLLTGLSTAAVVRNAYRAPGGTLWLLADSGELYSGDLDQGFVPGPHAPPGYWIELDGPRGDAPFELFALTADMQLAHFEPSQGWRMLQGPSAYAPRARRRLAWIEPGRVAVIGQSEKQVREVDTDSNEQVYDLAIPDNQISTDAAYAIEPIVDLGVVIGSRNNLLFLRRATGWERLEIPTIMPKVEYIVDLGDRSFVAGGAAELVQWVELYGLCPPTLFNAPSVEAGAALGSGFVLVTQTPTPAEDYLFTFFDPE